MLTCIEVASVSCSPCCNEQECIDICPTCSLQFYGQVPEVGLLDCLAVLFLGFRFLRGLHSAFWNGCAHWHWPQWGMSSVLLHAHHFCLSLRAILASVRRWLLVVSVSISPLNRRSIFSYPPITSLSSSNFFFFFFNFMCMGVLLACLCTTCVSDACGGQKGALEVPPTERWDLNPGSLQEQSVLLTTELSLQDLFACFVLKTSFWLF